MSKLRIIALTVVTTVIIEALLLQSWFLRFAVLNLLEPGPNDERAFVLTQPVQLRHGNKKIGEIAAGQVLFQPCRHDLHLTDLGDPSVYKIYVEFGGDTAWQNYATLVRDMPSPDNARTVLQLEKSDATTDRFLHHAEIIHFAGKSYRLKDRAAPKP